jgi:hypothetical protein
VPLINLLHAQRRTAGCSEEHWAQNLYLFKMFNIQPIGMRQWTRQSHLKCLRQPFSRIRFCGFCEHIQGHMYGEGTCCSSKILCVGMIGIANIPLTNDVTLIPNGSNSQLKVCAMDRRASSSMELSPDPAVK